MVHSTEQWFYIGQLKCENVRESCKFIFNRDSINQVEGKVNNHGKGTQGRQSSILE